MTATPAVHSPTRVESDFISMIRFLMIAGLAYHHMFGIPGSAFYPRDSLQTYTHFVPDLINGFFHMAFMAAVPSLSVISGFLFFRRKQLDFASLLKKRFLTVALPSWLWAAFWLLLSYVLYSLGRESGTFTWLNYGFDAFSFKTLFNGVVGYDQLPFAIQFWFVHDLILTLLLSPLIYLCLRKFQWPFMVVMSLWWLSQRYIPQPFFSLNVLFFFCVGACLGLPTGPGLHAVLKRLSPWGMYVAGVFALVLLARLFAHEFPEPFNRLLMGNPYLCLLRLLGILTFTHLVHVLSLREGWLKQGLLRYSGYSFFVFAFHFPLLLFVKAAALRVPGHDSALGFFLMWLLIPITTLMLCLLAARGVEKVVPPLFRLLNGGRSGYQSHEQFATKTA